MLSGTLAKQPEQRTSSKGNVYTTATLRTGEGDNAVFASVTAFGDLACILAGLAKGDPPTIDRHPVPTGPAIAPTRCVQRPDPLLR